MGFVIVLAIAVTVGVLVYRLTAPPNDVPDAGFERRDEPAAAAVVPDDVREWTGGDTEPRPGASDASGATGASPETSGEPGPARVELSPDAGSIPVVRTRPSWHSRLNGAMGLVVAIGIGAAAIALALYLVGTTIARMVSSGVN